MPPRLTTWWLDKKRRSKQKERRAARKAKCQKYATSRERERETIAERKTKKKRITAATECVNNKKANKFRHKQHVLQLGAKRKNKRDTATTLQSGKSKQTNAGRGSDQSALRRLYTPCQRTCVRVSVCMCVSGRQNSTPVQEANAHVTKTDLLSAQVYTRSVKRSCLRNWTRRFVWKVNNMADKTLISLLFAPYYTYCLFIFI